LAGLKGEMDREAGRYQAAETTIRLALSAAQGGDERRQALLLIQLGRLHLDQERFEDAKELFEKLDVTLESRGATALCAACKYHLGNIAAQGILCPDDPTYDRISAEGLPGAIQL